MGRQRKYKTKEEILAARRRWALEYYYRNQKEMQKKRMERYAKEVNN